jgi:hypothetical protein
MVLTERSHYSTDLLSREQLRQAQAVQGESGLSLDEILVNLGFVTRSPCWRRLLGKPVFH